MGNKIITVIASVLKPVDDTRMYEKFGQSLQQTNRYAVNIIGFISKNPPDERDIMFYPIFNFKNNSWKRFFVSLKFGKTLFKINPKLIIATTYELLPIVFFYKFFSPTVKVVYDVQENYALNVQTNHKNSIQSKILAFIIRSIEKLSQSFILLYTLAELGYANEISFASKNSIVIQNKFVQPHPCPQSNTNFFSKEKLKSHYPIMLFNGTISVNYGIFEAIDLVKNLREFYPKILLIIAGHVTNSKLLNKLVNIENQHPYIISMMDTSPIPHAEIIKLIEFADFGMVAHKAVESIKNCFPTRIYEYMAHKTPFILQDHAFWTDYCNPWDCAINIDYQNFDTQLVAQQMKTRQFYKKGIPKDIFWTTEAHKLIKAIDNTLGINHS